MPVCHRWVARALWVAMLFAAVSWRLAVASADPNTGTAQYAGAETCAGCHPAEYEEWKTSKHAGAFSQMFSTFWKERGETPECLVCHTTGFLPATREYAFKGVSCEACHGPLQPTHPQDASMPLPADSSMCMQCHRQTYLEWQLSGHAKHNIRCFDCHAVHRQGLRQPDVEQQCGSCHVERLQDFAHATHHLQGLTCSTCHMPHKKTTGIGGTGAPGHSFFVGAETCAACHEETVHRSHRLKDTLSGQVDRLVQENTAHLEELQANAQKLELQVDIERSRGIKLALAMLIVGLLIGVLSQGLKGLGRKRGNRHDHPTDAS